ncbi:MAG TPA: hypothetical protein VFS10_00545 [Pyrinomonadaceae bacterium]|nr:hypothetical protein [Pyrinomonadaceae bacterium]
MKTRNLEIIALTLPARERVRRARPARTLYARTGRARQDFAGRGFAGQEGGRNDERGTMNDELPEVFSRRFSVLSSGISNLKSDA